jgi:hypothetical protein
LRAEAKRLHQAKKWDAVVAVGTQLTKLDPTDADPDGLINSARAELEAAERSRLLAARYGEALQHMDAGSWRPALKALTAVQAIEADYRDSAELLARVRRELARAGELVNQPSQLKTINAAHPINEVAFSPDGRLLALGCADKTAWVVELATGQERFSVRHGRWRYPNNQIFGVAFSPDGRWLATGGDDQTARLWDTTSGNEFLKVTHRLDVDGVAFSPDGRWLATASDDQTAQIWQLLEASEGDVHA